LIPIFTARLKTLRAMAPGLRDLHRPAFDELESLLARAEALIRESVGPVPAGAEEIVGALGGWPATRKYSSVDPL